MEQKAIALKVFDSLRMGLKPHSSSYKFKLHLSDGYGRRAYIIGHLYPVPNMTGTQISGTSFVGLYVPMVATLMFSVEFLRFISEPVLPDGGKLYLMLIFLGCLVLWWRSIFTRYHVEAIQKFENYLRNDEEKILKMEMKAQRKITKAKRNDHNQHHPARTKKRF